MIEFCESGHACALLREAKEDYSNQYYLRQANHFTCFAAGTL